MYAAATRNRNTKSRSQLTVFPDLENEQSRKARRRAPLLDRWSEFVEPVPGWLLETRFLRSPRRKWPSGELAATGSTEEDLLFRERQPTKEKVLRRKCSPQI